MEKLPFKIGDKIKVKKLYGFLHPFIKPIEFEVAIIAIDTIDTKEDAIDTKQKPLLYLRYKGDKKHLKECIDHRDISNKGAFNDTFDYLTEGAYADEEEFEISMLDIMRDKARTC